jgi:hypothetical protein
VAVLMATARQCSITTNIPLQGIGSLKLSKASIKISVLNIIEDGLFVVM